MADKTPEEIAAEKAKASAPKKVKVRVIADHADHSVDDVLSLSADDAAVAVAAGWADDHPSAVKYAESQGKAKPAPVDADAA